MITRTLKQTLTEDRLRGIVLIVVVGVILTMALLGRSVPDWLVQFATLIIGYYFGRGVTNGIRAREE